MISCTQFIPLYNELFKYLESRGGHDAVLQYWYYTSDYKLGDPTNPNSLAAKCEQFGGVAGARAYWGNVLTEEACDTLSLANPEKKYYYSHMRYCPSRGMLNAMEHIEPYYDYCGHCSVIYQRVLNKYGADYIRDTRETDHAACRSLLYEIGGEMPDFDWRTIPDEEILKMQSDESLTIRDEKREGKKYLHRAFYYSIDNALRYCGETYGDEAVMEFFVTYTKAFYAPQIEEIRKGGLPAVKEFIEKMYTVDEAMDVLHTELTEDKLTVTVDACPAVRYIHSANQTPSKYLILQTSVLYDVIAKEAGLSFVLNSYHEEDGAAKYTFTK